MKLIENGENSNELENSIYEKVSDFRYLGKILSIKNDWTKIVCIWINKAKTHFVENIFQSIKTFNILPT